VIAAITLATAVKYVAAAYGVVWLMILLYVWILRSKYQRLEAQVGMLERELAERPGQQAADERPERITVS
jgi:CcmD family protein